MDYQFFHSLTHDEGQMFLIRFRESERLGLESLRPEAAEEAVGFDYSLSTLPGALRWMVRKAHVRRVPLPMEEPAWIRQAHPNGMIEFDDESKATILRAAYYLGECFARLPGLRWTTGDVEYLHKNMPVVAGFQLDDQMPPLVIVENLFAQILGDDAPEYDIDATVEVWIAKCPG
jgi:hypothetical protein